MAQILLLKKRPWRLHFRQENFMKSFSDKVNKAENNACPQAKDSYSECYGAKLDSESARKAVMYCLGDYMHCDIYLKHLKILNAE